MGINKDLPSVVWLMISYIKLHFLSILLLTLNEVGIKILYIVFSFCYVKWTKSSIVMFQTTKRAGIKRITSSSMWQCTLLRYLAFIYSWLLFMFEPNVFSLSPNRRLCPDYHRLFTWISFLLCSCFKPTLTFHSRPDFQSTVSIFLSFSSTF